MELECSSLTFKNPQRHTLHFYNFSKPSLEIDVGLEKERNKETDLFAPHFHKINLPLFAMKQPSENCTQWIADFARRHLQT